MKKFLKNRVYTSLLFVALIFTACQDEYEEVSTEGETETIVSNSATAKLIENTSAQDGSFDNIVDGVSCFAIEFPYTVNVNGLEVTVDSREDLQTIEEILDSVEIDEDILDIIFPITISAADYEEKVINSKEELRALAADCKEGGDDDDIECIDFVYPIDMFTFNINREQTSKVTINSDKELRRFFKSLEGNNLVGIDFPISLKLYDGSETTINSMSELVMTIENAREMCDEDDDNDHNDDDFTKERLDSYLVMCPWLIHEVNRQGVNSTDQYFEYAMNFKEDGTVKAFDREGNAIEGTWSTRLGENRVLLKLEFDSLVDFTLEWFIYEIEHGKIKLYAGEGDRIIMKKHCVEKDPNTLREVLRECSWVIKKVFVDDEEIKRLLGYEFNFEAEGVVTLSNGDVTSTGSWEITMNEQERLVMAITMGDEPGVSFEWPLSDLRDDRLKFEIPGTDYELILQRVCDNNSDDGDVLEIRNIMMGGAWAIASYTIGEEDLTQNYAGYSLDFDVENALGVYEGIATEPFMNGVWRVLRNYEQELRIYLNLGNHELFGELTKPWKLLSLDDNRIEFKCYDAEGILTKIVLEKEQ